MFLRRFREKHIYCVHVVVMQSLFCFFKRVAKPLKLTISKKRMGLKVTAEREYKRIDYHMCLILYSFLGSNKLRDSQPSVKAVIQMYSSNNNNIIIHLVPRPN